MGFVSGGVVGAAVSWVGVSCGSVTMVVSSVLDCVSSDVGGVAGSILSEPHPAISKKHNKQRKSIFQNRRSFIHGLYPPSFLGCLAHCLLHRHAVCISAYQYIQSISRWRRIPLFESSHRRFLLRPGRHQ